MPKIKLCPLKGKKNFEKLFDNGKKFYSEQALAIALFKNNFNDLINNKNIIFYAVSASKKSSKKAVVRNRIKRLLRVSIKNTFSLISEEHLKKIDSFLVIWRACPQKPSLIRLKDVQPVVQELVHKFVDYKIEE